MATLSLVATGCAPHNTDAVDAFSATGEVIAMGGGDAGPDGACFTCHGLEGQGDGRLTPRLAGLPVGYLRKQLADYATGLRPDPVMAPIARALSPSARERVAIHYARLSAPASPPVLTAARDLYHLGDPRRGLAPCAVCHGPRGEGGGSANPPLAGQPAPYLAEQLRRWKRADRRNDPQGTMLDVSRRLSDREVESLAAGFAASSAPIVLHDVTPAASP